MSGAKGLDKFLRKSLFRGDPVEEFDGCLRRLAPRLLLRNTIGEAFAAARVSEAKGAVTLPCEERERSTPYGSLSRRDGLTPRAHRRGA